jgi:hypothetical protein
MGQVILLSLTASLNPTLVAATTVMLLLPSPGKLMLGYLLGAYVTSITLGLVIVFTASDSSTTNTTENTLSPTVDIALGAIALVGAWFVWSGRHARLKSAGARARRQSPTRVPQDGSGSRARDLHGPRSSSGCCSHSPLRGRSRAPQLDLPRTPTDPPPVAALPLCER